MVYLFDQVIFGNLLDTIFGLNQFFGAIKQSIQSQFIFRREG